MPSTSFSSGPSASIRSCVIPQQYPPLCRDETTPSTRPSSLLSSTSRGKIFSTMGPILARRSVAVGTRAVGILISPLRPDQKVTAAVKLPWISSLMGDAMPWRPGSRMPMS